MVANVTAGQGVSRSISRSGKGQEFYPVYVNRLTPYYMGLFTVYHPLFGWLMYTSAWGRQKCSGIKGQNIFFQIKQKDDFLQPETIAFLINIVF